MVVEFNKNGTTYTGKIKDMPFKLMRQWAKTEHGELFIKNAIMEAEKIFWRALIENDI